MLPTPLALVPRQEERPGEYRVRMWPSKSQKESLHQSPLMLVSWSSTVSLQSCEKINFCCLNHPVCGVLLRQPACMRACSVSQLCPTLCDPLDHSRPDSSVHGISQARTLKWVAISFSRRSPPPRDQTCISCIGKQILYH